MNCPTASARLIVAMPRPVERVERRDEQADRLPRAHRDHQDRRGGERDDQGVTRVRIRSRHHCTRVFRCGKDFIQ